MKNKNLKFPKVPVNVSTIKNIFKCMPIFRLIKQLDLEWRVVEEKDGIYLYIHNAGEKDLNMGNILMMNKDISFTNALTMIYDLLTDILKSRLYAANIKFTMTDSSGEIINYGVSLRTNNKSLLYEQR